MRKWWRLLGSLLLLGLLASRMDWGQLAGAFASLKPASFLAALAVYVTAQCLSSLRWQLLARPLGFEGPWHRFTGYLFIGMFFNLALPSSVGGDVVRAWYLAREGTGRRSAAALSVFAERGSGLAMLVLLACAAACCCPTPLDSRILWIVATIGGLTFGGAAGFVVLTFFGSAASRLPFGSRLGRILDLASVYRRQTGVLVVTTALSLLVQVLNVFLVWLIGDGMGLPVPLPYYAVAVPLVTLLTLVPISLNGMGLRELGTVAVLAPLGVTNAQAVTLSVLQFAVYALVSLAGGYFYLRDRNPLLGRG